MKRKLKKEFLLDPDIHFLNHSSFGACPRPVFEVYQSFQRELEKKPVEFLGRQIIKRMEETRGKLAEYIKPVLLHVIASRSVAHGFGDLVLLGNMEVIEPTQEQLKVLESLVIFLKDRFGITHIAGHSDFNPDITVCPGMLLHKLLPDIAKTTGLIFGIEGYIPPPWVTTP